MEKLVFSETDCRQMEALGITKAQVAAQVAVFRKSSFHVRLVRPCTVGDGVQVVGRSKTDDFLRLHDAALGQGRFVKFVPASGAASRMFQSLLQIYYVPQFLEADELQRRASRGVSVACEFLRFLEAIDRFPFWDDLRVVMARDGLDLEAMIAGCRYRTILEYLLTSRGLNYGSLPKGLLKFHRYPNECRTAFEEHLVEATQYAGSRGNSCQIHFTVSPEHVSGFRRLFERVRCSLEERFGTSFDICFSFQKPCTDTIAVDMENQPFRDLGGNLHFRPGGHGALLENLNDLRADLVYIKNVDNLTTDRHKEEVAFWKRVLGGCLASVQETVHDYLRKLHAGQMVEAAAYRYAKETLLMDFSPDFDRWPSERQRSLLVEKLNRPIRVCGVVRNSGEPGGAPFWVEDKTGAVTVQIVEKAQVDFSSPEQENIWMSSTHFNPVDIVCGVRDFQGKPFDLRRYVDGDAVFISKKSKDGKELKALELPGLWNGAMADWITVIVEVPKRTFNPVKTVYDLLRPEHQPEP
ncbi:MAG: DUF4301 family protein [Syntrophobacteraceae bacterium]|nr:DUF4301 family protein [Desulfobacteraceae bacterium]